MIQCVIKYIKQVCDYHEKKRSGKRKNVIKDALDYVNRNLYNPELSLKKVASDLYINDSYLSREFKKTYGVSFIEYISRKRIEASKKLLKETELKVYEVAEKIGFCCRIMSYTMRTLALNIIFHHIQMLMLNLPPFLI